MQKMSQKLAATNAKTRKQIENNDLGKRLPRETPFILRISTRDERSLHESHPGFDRSFELCWVIYQLITGSTRVITRHDFHYQKREREREAAWRMFGCLLGNTRRSRRMREVIGSSSLNFWKGWVSRGRWGGYALSFHPPWKGRLNVFFSLNLLSSNKTGKVWVTFSAAVLALLLLFIW